MNIDLLLGNTTYVVPLYRDYKTADEVLEAWNAGKDFRILNSTTHISCRDNIPVTIMFNGLNDRVSA